jgi:hypothetical protein
MLSLILLVSTQVAAPVTPPCSVRNRPVVNALRAMPPSIQQALAHRMADRGQAFNRTDVIAPGRERLPFLRLICGYATPTGYVVEREQGGRGYNIGAIRFTKVGARYIESK